MRTPVRPAAVVAPAVVAALFLALRAPAGVRVAPMMAVLVATPGLVAVRHVRTRSRTGVAVIACAVGIAWLVLTSEVLVYLRWWKPAVLIPATLCISIVLGMSPLHRAAHAIRWDRCRTMCVALAGAAVGFVVALQTYAVMRTPYSAAELRPLHAAWLLATGRHDDSATAPDSMLSEIQARLIPFHNPSVGSLLGARWLQLGLLALTVALAGLWAHAGAERRGSPAMWATVIGAAALVHIDAAGPGTLLAGPLLMGAGSCITANRNGTTRPGVAGLLLAAAALESRICAFAAAAFVISEVHRCSERRPHTVPAWFGPRVRMLAGVVAGGVCLSAAAAVLHVRLGALAPSAADAAGRRENHYHRRTQPGARRAPW